MDIADIRKKAKAGRRAVQPEPQPIDSPPVMAAEPPPRLVEPAASAVVPAVPVVEPIEQSSAPVPKVEPKRKKSAAVAGSLEEMFELIPDFDLATEDGYQHGLDRRGHEVEEDMRRFLTFSLGQEEYALDIADIREIIKPREITDIPRVPGFLLGIISLRGSIIPIFDLKSRLKLGTGVITAEARIVVCSHGQRTAGLLVDRIAQVVTLPATQIEPPPAVLSGLDRDLVEGVGRHQGKMMILLQMASVLNAELT